MSSDTPGTRSDPELAAEGDTDQPTKEDQLLDRGVEDLQDEGVSPPDRPHRHLRTTPREEIAGDAIDERVTQEEPEVWDEDSTVAVGQEADRVGRLTAASREADGEAGESLAARDEGVAGGGASAEEAAVHLDDES